MGRATRHLSYANVVATLALVVAVAGGATAAAGGFKAPKNSVTSKSIRDGNVTARDLTTAVRVTSSAAVAAGAIGTTTASCPSGARAIGGSGGISAGFVISSGMAGAGNAWSVSAFNNSSSPNEATVSVWCLIAKPGKPTS